MVPFHALMEYCVVNRITTGAQIIHMNLLKGHSILLLEGPMRVRVGTACVRQDGSVIVTPSNGREKIITKDISEIMSHCSPPGGGSSVQIFVCGLGCSLADFGLQVEGLVHEHASNPLISPTHPPSPLTHTNGSPDISPRERTTLETHLQRIIREESLSSQRAITLHIDEQFRMFEGWTRAHQQQQTAALNERLYAVDCRVQVQQQQIEFLRQEIVRMQWRM